MNDARSNTSDSHQVNGLQRFVAVCEQFEADWRAGSAPRLDAYLHAVEPSERHGLFCELLAIEIELRLQLGETAVLEEYQANTRNGPKPPNWSSREIRVHHPSHRSGAGQIRRSRRASPSSIFPLAASGEQTVTVGNPPVSKPALPVQLIPENFGRYTVVVCSGRGVRHGLPCVGRRAGTQGGDQGAPTRAPGFARAGRARSLPRAGSPPGWDIRRSSPCTTSAATDENGVFVVFEYIEGRNLAEILGAEPLSPRGSSD